LGPHKVSLMIGAKRVNSDFVVCGYDEIKLSQDDAKAAFEVVSRACAGAPREMMLAGLTKARIKCRKRGEDGVNEKAVIMAYVEVLAQWPADVAMKVIGKMHALEDGWWPSAASVEKELALCSRGRKFLLNALYDAGCRPLKGDEAPQVPKHHTRTRVSHSERFKAISAELIRRGYDFIKMNDAERNLAIAEVTADLDEIERKEDEI